MKLVKTKTFEKDYVSLPVKTRKKVDKQLKFLAASLRHPSIHAKKISGKKDIWEGRVNRFYRFSFKIEGDKIYLRHVGPHNQTLRKP